MPAVGVLDIGTALRRHRNGDLNTELPDEDSYDSDEDDLDVWNVEYWI